MARITRRDVRPGRFRFTTGGDLIFDLKLPARVYLYFPTLEERKPGNLIKPAIEGISGEGQFMPVLLEKLSATSQKGWLQLSTISPREESDNSHYQNIIHLDLNDSKQDDRITGSWVCIPRDTIESDDVYYYQLVGMKIALSLEEEPVAEVESVMDTAAHGVIVARMLETNREVMVPFVDEFVELRLDTGRILIPTIHDFCI